MKASGESLCTDTALNISLVDVAFGVRMGLLKHYRNSVVEIRFRGPGAVVMEAEIILGVTHDGTLFRIHKGVSRWDILFSKVARADFAERIAGEIIADMDRALSVPDQAEPVNV